MQSANCKLPHQVEYAVPAPLVSVEISPRSVAVDPPNLVILLHGYGSNEQDLLELGPALGPDFHVVALRGPISLDRNAFAWFEIGWGPAGITMNDDQAAESLSILSDHVATLIDRESNRYGKVVIGGFSQGAMMSLAMALALPQLFDGLLMMSGRVLPKLVPPPEPTRFHGLKALVQHGTRDQVLSFEGSREATRLLQAFGADTEHHEYSMAHEVTAQSLKDIEAWASKNWNSA